MVIGVNLYQCQKILIRLIMRVPLPYLLMVETLYLWPVRINLEPIMVKTEVVKEAVTFFMPKKLEILGTDL